MRPRKKLLTAKQAKAYLRRNGLTVPAFSKMYGFNEKTVYRVLNGEIKGHYGEGHEIAVTLGMKRPDQAITETLPAAH